MNPQQIRLVRASYLQLEPIGAEAAALFYGHLFAAAPQLRPLFKVDLTRQGTLLMQMIGYAVALLGLPALEPALHRLGARHAGYRVQPAHYELVGAALMKKLAQGLGDAFTPELRAAWAECYALISRTMLEGARPHEAEHRATPEPSLQE